MKLKATSASGCLEVKAGLIGGRDLGVLHAPSLPILASNFVLLELVTVFHEPIVVGGPVIRVSCWLVFLRVNIDHFVDKRPVNHIDVLGKPFNRGVSVRFNIARVIRCHLVLRANLIKQVSAIALVDRAFLMKAVVRRCPLSLNECQGSS